jgi:hypothetical protein
VENGSPDESPTYGRPLTEADEPWTAAVSELGPAKSLERIDEYNKTLLSTVTLVGAILTGLGLVSGPTLTAEAFSKIVASVAIAVALASVLTALAAFSVGQDLNLQDLMAVAAFFTRRARRARWAGRLLGLALLLAMVAALSAVLLPKEPAAAPSLALVSSEMKTNATLRFAVAKLQPGAVVTGWMTADPAGTKRVIGQQTTAADQDGKALLEIVVNGLQGVSEIEATTIAGDRKCTATLPVGGNANSGPSGFKCTSQS